MPKPALRAAARAPLRLATIAGVNIAVALLVMALKYLAYLFTGSVALLSDALESIVNLITAIAALVSIQIAARPPDTSHPYGHHKVEYFSAVVEGVLIVVAAILILREAWEALPHPHAIAAPTVGMLISGVATTILAGWSWFLVSRGRAMRSRALEADGWHLFSDVATSLGVLAGLGLAMLTGWPVLDPLLAICVALYILFAGFKLARDSVSGLMDEAASPEIQSQITALIRENGNGALQVHDIRTRHAGPATFIEFHLVVPGVMTVADSHDICDRLEHAIKDAVEGAQISIHVEPEFKAKAKGAVTLS